MIDAIHPVFLPFDEDTVLAHFAPVAGDAKAKKRRHLDYYLASAARAAALAGLTAPTPAEIRAGRQMEKDERFWVAASLMALFHEDRGPASAFGDLLGRIGLKSPAGLNWELALSDCDLYFEANLGSPTSYRAWLVNNVDERAMVPYQREAAKKVGPRLEGPTKVDALLISRETGTAVLFEAKVLSDLSTRVNFDVTRNQLARIIDVALDPSPTLQEPLNRRDPDRTYVVLVTPELLSSNGPPGAHRGRLYGWLLPEYQDPASQLLGQHLPHRNGQLGGIHQRLGWATWEQINEVCPGACRWLDGSAGGV